MILFNNIGEEVIHVNTIKGFKVESDSICIDWLSEKAFSIAKVKLEHSLRERLFKMELMAIRTGVKESTDSARNYYCETVIQAGVRFHFRPLPKLMFLFDARRDSVDDLLETVKATNGARL